MFIQQEHNSVWNRTDASGHILSATAYNIVIGATLLWGFLANYLIVGALSPTTISKASQMIWIRQLKRR